MPIYEYQCNACCRQFEQLSLRADEPFPSCPECGCADVQRLMSAGSFRAQGVATGSGGFNAPAGCKPSG